jgi:hypothetical protein
MDSETTVHGEDREGLSRRDALKRGAIGTGVVGVAWAAPAIVGLSSSPAYGATSSNSHVPCTGDASFDIPIPCPVPGGGSTDVTPQGDCGKQHITADTHWADLTPNDPGGSPVKFNHFQVNDANGQFLLVTVKRHGNDHCKFANASVDNPPQTAFGDPNTSVNTSNGTRGTGPSQSGDKVQIIYSGDPNYHDDLGRPNCSGKFHIGMHCT